VPQVRFKSGSSWIYIRSIIPWTSILGVFLMIWKYDHLSLIKWKWSCCTCIMISIPDLNWIFWHIWSWLSSAPPNKCWESIKSLSSYILSFSILLFCHTQWYVTSVVATLFLNKWKRKILMLNGNEHAYNNKLSYFFYIVTREFNCIFIFKI
jgi:hypothetical protein